VSTSLLVSTGAVTCYSASMVIWFADKNVHCVSATQPSRNLCVLVHCLAGSCNQQQKSSYPHKCVKAIVSGDFCGRTNKALANCHQKTKWSSPSKQGSYSVTDSTSWDEQACTHDTLWRQYYAKTSKKYL